MCVLPLLWRTNPGLVTLKWILMNGRAHRRPFRDVGSGMSIPSWLGIAGYYHKIRSRLSPYTNPCAAWVTVSNRHGPVPLTDTTVASPAYRITATNKRERGVCPIPYTLLRTTKVSDRTARILRLEIRCGRRRSCRWMKMAGLPTDVLTRDRKQTLFGRPFNSKV